MSVQCLINSCQDDAIHYISINAFVFEPSMHLLISNRTSLSISLSVYLGFFDIHYNCLKLVTSQNLQPFAKWLFGQFFCLLASAAPVQHIAAWFMGSSSCRGQHFNEAVNPGQPVCVYVYCVFRQAEFKLHGEGWFIFSTSCCIANLQNYYSASLLKSLCHIRWLMMF